MHASVAARDRAVVSTAFRAMGTRVRILVAVEPGRAGAARSALDAARVWFGRVEGVLSRFRRDSELSRLNRSAPGRWIAVSPLLFSALQAAKWAHGETGGLFDASVLPVLEAWGYDRTWEDLPHLPPAAGSLAALTRVASAASATAPTPPARRGFELDPVVQAVRLEPGTALDLGGIGKGLAADTAAERLARRFSSVLVDAGGDVATRARHPGEPWRVELAEMGGPRGEAPPCVELRDGGVATSAVYRSWMGPRGPAHHLIDPRTEEPARSGVVAASVVAGSAVRAEVLAKALVVAGLERAARMVAAWPDASAFLRTRTGEVLRLGVRPDGAA